MAGSRSDVLVLGASAPEFALTDVTSGRMVGLGDFAEARALLIAVICNHCPYVVHIRPSFSAFAREQQQRGLAVVAISANDPKSHPQDGPQQMAAEAKRSQFTFPYLFDETQAAAKALGAACTPDFYLFDQARRLVYHGRYDASTPGNRIAASGDDLATAVAATLAGKAAAADQRSSVGCSIKWKAGNAPAY